MDETISNQLLKFLQQNVNHLPKKLFIFGISILLFDYCFKKTPIYKWAIIEKQEIFFKTYFMTDKGLRGSEFDKTGELKPVTWPLVDFIDKSEKYLDICLYVITANNVIEAILEAHKRKVNIRIILDYKTGLYNSQFARKLLREGVPIFAKNVETSSIMHHKFCIRDKKVLLQSSMNLTQNSAKGCFDNLIVTDHKELVFEYQLVFDTLVDQIKNGTELFQIEQYKVLNDKKLLKKYVNDENLYEHFRRKLRKQEFNSKN